MKSNWSVYIILCSDESLYTGISTDVNKRFENHNNRSGAKYFRNRKPSRIVYLETGHDRTSATKREHAIKKMTRTEKLILLSSKFNGINQP